ncbi:Acyltransferase 3 [Phytophthora cactorum]|nr:Acyltransferase 3 [Phytophthora cactorum]
MVVLDIQEIKCDASRSATTASSPRRQVQSEAVFLVVDGGAAEEKETGEIVSKREPSGRVKLKFLNGLRGLASLLIVHHHAGYLLEVTIAPSSVDIFFVLSSFLLTMINASKIQKLVAHKASFREWIVVLLDYFVKRLLRVYPLFASNTNSLLQSRALQHSIVEPLGYFDIQEALLPFWTMPIEIAYYFMIPLFLVGHCYLDKAPKAKWSVIGLLYIWVYYEGCYTQRTTHGEFRPHLPTFLAGSLAAAVYLDLSKAMKKRTFEPSKWHLVAVRAFELTMLSTMISDVCRGLLVRWFNGSLFPSQHPAVPSVSLPISTHWRRRQSLMFSSGTCFASRAKSAFNVLTSSFRELLAMASRLTSRRPVHRTAGIGVLPINSLVLLDRAQLSGTRYGLWQKTSKKGRACLIVILLSIACTNNALGLLLLVEHVISTATCLHVCLFLNKPLAGSRLNFFTAECRILGTNHSNGVEQSSSQYDGELDGIIKSVT